MAEELIQGGVSWWNLPLNLFNSSPCSSAYNEIGSLDWPSHDLMTNIKTVRSGDDSGGSASQVSSSAAGQDFHQPDRHWNQEFVSDCGRSADNYSKFLLDNYHDLPTSNSNNFSEDPSIHTLQSATNSYGFLLSPYAKRPRIETLSPLPTFKVRKEKMGDRITALQQLVSPFGKTDTASVLHEAIEYIKFLHDQVNALSTPYMKYATPLATLEQVADKQKDQKGLRNDLKTRGLCLVPISNSFPAAPETTNIDFWTPTFGGSFK